MLDIIDQDGIRELRMARPPVNALDPELIRALRDALSSAPDDNIDALILTGAEGLFSAGLDLPALLQLDRDGMAATWRDLFGLCEALARSPIPVVAAVSGHSPAGGAVLALFCDYRVMAHGPFRIGLNEVAVGLCVPAVIQAALRRLVGEYRAERLLVSGTMLESEQADQIGLVDELAAVDQVTTRARVWLEELLALPRQAMLATRLIARESLGALFDDPDMLDIDGFVDFWFSAEAQSTMHAMVAELKAKRAAPR